MLRVETLIGGGSKTCGKFVGLPSGNVYLFSEQDGDCWGDLGVSQLSPHG